jgi:hypothetical protein
VYKLRVKIKDKMDAYAHVPVAPAPGSGELQSRHVPHGPGSRLLAQGSSRAVTYLMTLAPATRPEVAPGPSRAPRAPAHVSWLRAALELPRVPRAGSTSRELLK